MKAEDIIVGELYIVSVSRRLTPVRVTARLNVGPKSGQWVAINTRTKRKVVIRWPGRFKSRVENLCKRCGATELDPYCYCDC